MFDGQLNTLEQLRADARKAGVNTARMEAQIRKHIYTGNFSTAKRKLEELKEAIRLALERSGSG